MKNKITTAVEAREISDKRQEGKLQEELEELQQAIWNQAQRGSYKIVRAHLSEEAKTILTQKGYSIEIDIHRKDNMWIVSW